MSNIQRDIQRHTISMSNPGSAAPTPSVDAVTRAVLHALELAERRHSQVVFRPHRRRIQRSPLRPSAGRLPSPSHRPQPRPPAQLRRRHPPRPTQLAALRTELDPNTTRDSVLAEFRAALRTSAARVRAFSPDQYNRPAQSAALPSPPPSAACSSTAPTTPSATPARPSPPPNSSSQFETKAYDARPHSWLPRRTSTLGSASALRTKGPRYRSLGQRPR